MRALVSFFLRILFLGAMTAVLGAAVLGRADLVNQRVLQVLDNGRWVAVDVRSVANRYPAPRSRSSVVVVDEARSPLRALLGKDRTVFYKYNLQARNKERIAAPRNLKNGSTGTFLWNDPVLWVEAFQGGKQAVLSYRDKKWILNQPPFLNAAIELFPSRQGVWIVAQQKQGGCDVYRFDGKRWQHFPHLSSDLTGPGGQAPVILEDYAGRVWLISHLKLMLLQPLGFSEVRIGEQTVAGARRGWATDEGNWFIGDAGFTWISKDLSEKKDVAYEDLKKKNNGVPLLVIGGLSGAVYRRQKSILLWGGGRLWEFDGAELSQVGEPAGREEGNYLFATEDGSVLREAASAPAAAAWRMSVRDYHMQAAFVLAAAAFAGMQLIGFAFERRPGKPGRRHGAGGRDADSVRSERAAARDAEDRKIFLRAASVVAFLISVLFALGASWALSQHLVHPQEMLQAGRRVPNLDYQEVSFAFSIFAAAFAAVWLGTRALTPQIFKLFERPQTSRRTARALNR